MRSKSVESADREIKNLSTGISNVAKRMKSRFNAKEKKGHSLGIDAIYQYSGSITRVLAGLLFYIAIDRLFDTTSVGAIALLIAIAGLFNAFFSLGLGAAAQHFISADLGKEDYGSARRTILRIVMLSFVATLAGVAVLEVFSSQISLILFHSIHYVYYVRLTSIVLFTTNLFVIFNGILLGLQKFRASGVITMITWVTYYFVAIILALMVRSLFEVIMGWIIGMFIGLIIESLLIIRSVMPLPHKGAIPDNSTFYGFLLPVFFAGLMSYGSTYSDRFIVAGLLPLSQLGVYNFALLFALTMWLIAAPFNNILMPKFSELFGKGEREKIRGYVQGSILLLSFLYVPIALAIASISPILLDVLGGSKYVEGATPLMVIMFLSALFSPQYVLTQAVVSVRKTYVLLISGSVPLASNVALSILLIPSFGLLGAAIGFSSVYVATFFILLYFSNKEQLVSFEMVGMLKIWAASLVMFGSIYSFSYLTGNQIILAPVYVIIGILVYIGMNRALRTFTGKSKEIVSALFPSHNTVYRIFAAVLNVR